MKVCAFCGQCYDDSVVECSGDGHPDLSEAKDRNPAMIAGYRLDTLLESGVRGETYRAIQTEFNRSCLIRILPCDKTNSDQFLREARAANGFFHPNVVDIYETGELETSEVFVVAEDPDGKDLRGFLSNVGVPELLNTIEVVRQTAEALDALHSKGLTHGAIRPENIILATNPEGILLVRLQNADLGGLVQRSIISNKFLIDTALDSVRYFAPEQCAGDATSPQTDVYSLGVVMYEMLAGTPPFDASRAAGLIEKHRTQRPPDVRIDNFELRMLVTHALSESLQKQPKMRQSSANLFARQMRHIELEATHVSTPPPAGAVPAPPSPVRTVTPVKVIEARPPISVPVIPIATHPVMRPEDPIASPPSHERITPAIEAKANVDEPTVVPDVPQVVEAREQKTSTSVHERLSRMKQRMKTWRAKVSVPQMFETPVVEPIDLSDASEVERVKDAIALNVTPLVQAKAEEIAPEKIAPTQIASEQPEDDIPSVDDVVEILAKEHAVEIPLVETKTSDIEWIAAPVDATFPQEVDDSITEAIESVQPELEIPRVEPAPIAPVRRKKIRAKKPDATPVVREDPAPVPVVHEAPVVRETPVAIPVVREPRSPVPAVLVESKTVATSPASEPAKIRSDEAYARIPWIKGVLKDQPKEPARVAVVPDELEEITVVRARSKPIRIDLERPRVTHGPRRDRMFDTTDEVRFVPTLLGDVEKRRTIDLGAIDSPIFAHYGGRGSSGSSIRRRVLTAGGASALLIVGFLFAADLGRYARTESSDASVAEKTEQQASLPTAEPPTTVPPAKKISLKSVEKPQPVAEKAEEKVSKPAVTKAQPERSVEPRTTPANQPVKKVDSVQTKRTAETVNVVPEKKPAAAASKTGGATRPRIVGGP